ncbi:uncharacterized protein LTR77_006078 [Saxophila tyrrhenica]|uniref:F-box domain-containing protein n=1 Tax=Saxophila tyrrhenica TaxID=1690608 RepID=A0AAV9P9X4_9PEZI|nr:hypothetical protein LTR77_006078 [Saxophila tyrrhenica]
MAKKQFEDLPEDVKGLIVEKVLRPTDLVNLCLVNKQLHTLAVKPLCRTVHLELGSPSDSRLSAFFSPKNIGLPYIRSIWLHSAHTKKGSGLIQQAKLMLRMLLEFLPENILEELRSEVPELQEINWCAWPALSAENVLMLYHKQRKMKWLEAMELDRNVLPVLQKHEGLRKDMFASARNLRLFLGTWAILNLGGFLVTNMKDTLETLIVHCNFDQIQDTGRRSTTRNLNDSATAPGLLTRTIFSSMLPFDKCEPLQNLTRLDLHCVGLRFCEETWCKVINFRSLKELSIYFCSAADSLLARLSTMAHLPTALKSLTLHHSDNDEHEALTALDGLLHLINGLETLIIDMCGVDALPAARGITRQKTSLRILSVHCVEIGPDREDDTTSGRELVYSNGDFLKICKANASLIELSCAWPAASLLSDTNGDWVQWEIACSFLRHLVTLHLSTWPSTNSLKKVVFLPRNIYDSLLRCFAQSLLVEFNRPAPPVFEDDSDPEQTAAREAKLLAQPSHLRVIAFGVHHNVFERRESKNMICFLRSTSRDAEGREQTFAATLNCCLRKFVEPRSTVLEIPSEIRTDVRAPGEEEERAPRIFGWGDDE